jgi:hypothetical protein
MKARLTTESTDASYSTRSSRRSHIFKRISNSAEIYKGETALKSLAVLPFPNMGMIFRMTCKTLQTSTIYQAKRTSVLI